MCTTPFYIREAKWEFVLAFREAGVIEGSCIALYLFVQKHCMSCAIVRLVAEATSQRNLLHSNTFYAVWAIIHAQESEALDRFSVTNDLLRQFQPEIVKFRVRNVVRHGCGFLNLGCYSEENSVAILQRRLGEWRPHGPRGLRSNLD
jgi:hypothetical protein